MAYEPYSAEVQRSQSRFGDAIDRSGRLSRRAYNLLMGGLVTLGFAVMGVFGLLASSPAFLYAVLSHYTFVTFASFAVSLGGIFVVRAGMNREGYGMALAGYALIVLSMGFTTGLVLPFFDLPTIANAFVGTALIAALFTLLGATYPAFFAKAQGVAFFGLLALLVVSVVSGFMNVYLGWLDYAVIAVFCLFIGWDTYRAQQCEPTVKMAIFNAVEIWLDLLNVFIRILSILGNRRD